MDNKLKIYKKGLMWTIIVQNIAIIATVAFLLINYSNIFVGSVEDEYFTRYDNLCLKFIYAAAVCMAVGVLVPKIVKSTGKGNDGKNFKDRICVILIESVFVIGLAAFAINRYGGSDLYNIGDGSAFDGNENFLIMTMLPFIAIGVIGFTAGIIYYLKSKKKAFR